MSDHLRASLVMVSSSEKVRLAAGHMTFIAGTAASSAATSAEEKGR